MQGVGSTIVNPYECFLLMCLMTDCPSLFFPRYGKNHTRREKNQCKTAYAAVSKNPHRTHDENGVHFKFSKHNKCSGKIKNHTERNIFRCKGHHSIYKEGRDKNRDACLCNHGHNGRREASVPCKTERLRYFV